MFWETINLYYILGIGCIIIYAFVQYKNSKTAVKSQPPHTTYLYYQGVQASQVQAARYVEENTLILSTNEKAVHPKTSVNTILRERLWVYPELKEIRKNTRVGMLGRIEHLVHGIKIRRLNHGESVPYQTLYKTDEEGTLHHYSVDASRASMGQITDILAHKCKYDALMAEYPETNIVLYGVSRGAATSFAALAMYQYKNVKLCILEAVPSSVSDLVKDYVGRIPGLTRLGKFFYNPVIAHLFLGHQHRTDKSAQAIGYAHLFPMNVPLVIISSKADRIVSAQISIKLALKVAALRIESNESDIQPVYFLLLNKPGHNAYTAYGQEDSIRYHNFIHAVYKRHGLPHDEESANKGWSELDLADLTSKHNREFMQQQIEFWSNKAERALIRNQAFAALKNSPQRTVQQVEVFSQAPLFAKCIEYSYCFFKKNPYTAQLRQLRKEMDEEFEKPKHLSPSCH